MQTTRTTNRRRASGEWRIANGRIFGGNPSGLLEHPGRLKVCAPCVETDTVVSIQVNPLEQLFCLLPVPVVSYRPYAISYKLLNAACAARMVLSMSAEVWAVERNAASNCEGAR